MKRVYIDPRHRGQQLGEKLLAALEAAAMRDCHTLRLETGIQAVGGPSLYALRLPAAALCPYQPIRSAFYGETADCGSSFSSAIKASSWRVFAPRRHTSQVFSQRQFSASGQAPTW
jgi:GNAT superfamily N-acetyltransferase